MEVGQPIRLRTYGGEVIQRRVVKVLEDDAIAVCTDEEFRTAEREGREPVSVGFKKQDVVR